MLAISDFLTNFHVKLGYGVNVLHTADILGDPDSKYGSVDIYANGGRLQPGCYTNTSDITQCK